MLLYLFALTALLYVVFFFLKPILESSKQQDATTYYHEYVESGPVPDPKSQGRAPFPSLFDKPTKYLSLIVPAYNEELRMEGMLNEALKYLLEREKDASFTFEIIIVDDGSKDATAKVAMEYVKKYSSDVVRLMKLSANQGKGGAVQQGMLHARGKYLLMVDSDGATRIEDLIQLEDRLKLVEKDGLGIAVGSRAQYEKKALAERAWYRNILMIGFHFLVSTLCVRGIRDTQCGFKLFSRRAAQYIFPNQHLRRWSFDVELLYLAQHSPIPISIEEVPVRWMEIDGSKLNVATATLQMGRDLFVIRLCYLLGFWRAHPTSRFMNLARSR
jgi:dolichyl-phosphate beta-glucosyltransferase